MNNDATTAIPIIVCAWCSTRGCAACYNRRSELERAFRWPKTVIPAPAASPEPVPQMIGTPAPFLVAVFCDGGVITKNPSPIGGTWAWVMVGSDGEKIASARGAVAPVNIGLPAVSNNYTELLAAVRAMIAIPDDGAAVTLYTDSFVTQCRITTSESFRGIPPELEARCRAERKRLAAGGMKVVLLGGHPNRKELAAGVRKDGLPVSKWNVFCDEECGRAAREFLAAPAVS